MIVMTKQDTYIYIGAAFILNHTQIIIDACTAIGFFRELNKLPINI